jgi:hypothetical protein
MHPRHTPRALFLPAAVLVVRDHVQSRERRNEFCAQRIHRLDHAGEPIIASGIQDLCFSVADL